MSLAPTGVQLPTTGWDKTNHLAGFATLAILGNWAYGSRTSTVMAALLAYGALIEVLQSLTTYRTAEWGDLLADALGITMGWAWIRLRRTLGRAKTPRPTAGRHDA
jgi:VanZ family protein